MTHRNIHDIHAQGRRHVRRQMRVQTRVSIRERKGLTLIEVMIALVILSVATLSVASYMTRFARSISASDVKATANEVAADRIEEVKGAPRYSAIDSLYPGTTVMTGAYQGYTRKTYVTHTGGGASDFYDYKTVTVVVSNSRLAAPIKKTSVIAAF